MFDENELFRIEDLSDWGLEGLSEFIECDKYEEYLLKFGFDWFQAMSENAEDPNVKKMYDYMLKFDRESLLDFLENYTDNEFICDFQEFLIEEEGQSILYEANKKEFGYDPYARDDDYWCD